MQLPKRRCGHPGCPKFKPCPDHHKEWATRTDQERGSAASRGYDSRWERARKHFLREHPLCAECEKEDRVTAATVVDHIIPHKGDRALFWDSENNWQALCKTHHDRKTACEGAFGNKTRKP